MKLERSRFLDFLNLSAAWETWLLVLFIVLATISGGLAAFIGAELGWIGLIAVPGMIVALAILIWPLLGLSTFIFIIFIQLSYVINNYHSGIPAPGMPLLGVLLFLIIWRMVIYGDRPTGWKRASIIFLVIVAWLLSVLVADNFTYAIQSFQKFVENALLAFVVVFFITDKYSLRVSIWTILLAGAFMASISVFQYLTSTYGNFYWGYGGWIEATTGGSNSHRLAGPYGNPNAYAQVLVVIVPLALDRLWHEKKISHRILAGYVIAVCTLAIFFTYSRNGFVTLILTLGFLVFMRRPRIGPLVITGMLGILLLQFLPVSYTERITTLFQFSSGSSSQVADQSFRGRISENLAAWMMFKDHPLLGVGLDNFQMNYQSYSRQIGIDSRRDQRSPASFYLELLSEQGLVGTTIFLIFLVFIFRELWKAYQKFSALEMYDSGFMTVAFVSGLLGYQTFYISKNSAYPNVFWILLGLSISIAQVAENSEASLRSRMIGVESK